MPHCQERALALGPGPPPGGGGERRRRWVMRHELCTIIIRRPLGFPAARVTAAFPVCVVSGFRMEVSMEPDGQVSSGSEAQVSASMVLEPKAKNHRVPIQG